MTFVTKENTQDIYPLSPTQKGMLFHTLYDETTPVYFEQVAFTINGQLDIDKLKEAWTRLIAITPVFRTVFKWSKVKDPLQIVLKELPVIFEVHDIKGLDDKEQQRRIGEFLKKDKRNLFDMEEGPLTRLNIFILAGNKYKFIWSYHHIILDGWCLPIILNDLFSIYLAVATGGAMPRITRRPYKDYIAWYLDQDKEEAVDFWKGLLGDFQAATPLPLDRRTADGAVTSMGEEKVLLSPEMTEALLALSRKEHVTPSTVMQSAWSVLLSRYSNSDDVVFGATVSGRPDKLKGSDEMVGLFINTLPVRVRFAPGMKISELLGYLQKLSLSIREYEYSFLPEIKALTALPKTQNLFDSNVVFENYPLASAGGGSGMGITDVQSVEMTNFPITLLVIPGESMEMAIQYDRARFDSKTISRMLGHMLQVLSAFIKDPFQEVGRIEILTEPEKEMLNSFNSTEVPYPDTLCIQELFDRQVDISPDRTAIISGEKSLSYIELERKSNQIAHFLRDKGIKPDSVVGVFIERSVEMITGVLGIIKAGGAYVPLDPEYPAARLEYMLSDCGAPLILTKSDMLSRMPAFSGEVLCLDDDWDRIEQMPSVRPELVNTSRDLVYVIYTSGSTGNPKGIEIEHRGLVNYITWAAGAYDVPGHGSFPLYTSMSFDLTVTSMFLPLVSGEYISIMPSGIDPTTLVEHVLTSGTDIAKLTPAHLEIADNLTENGLEKSASLNRFILGGEALSAKTSRSFLIRHPGSVIFNEYGPAETVVGCIVYAFSELDSECTNVPIGKPIANTKIYIMDKDRRLVPIGVPGEIYIESPGVARGYLNKPEISAKSFVPSPFDPAKTIYRTGDLARWLADGNIEYLGRVDHQVKIRGYRIELGEVEALLASYNGIHDCVVVDRDDRTSGKYLVGYYVSEDEIPVTDIKNFMKEKLPEYMVPARFMKLDMLPLTPNGKVDRKALPEVDNVISGDESSFVAPRTEIEHVIADVWCQVLKLNKVGIHDNFFDLGGDSIISLQVAGRLKKQGYEIKPRDIFENQTIAELALVAGKARSALAEQGDVTGEAPLTPVQKWLFELDLNNINHFNQAIILKTSMALDEDALKKSLQLVINHHDVLRSRFKGGMQVYLPSGEEPVLVKASVSDEDELKVEIDKLQSSLDICAGPVFVSGLFTFGESVYLALVAHHLVVDGVSWRIIVEDMFSAYGEILQGSQPAMPEKTSSFKEWAVRIRNYADQIKDEAGFLNEMIKENHALITEDFKSGPNDMASVAVVHETLSKEDTDLLLKGAHDAFNTEINDILVLSLARTLAAKTGSDHVCFNMEGHGREDIFTGIDISRTVGWFTTLFPVSVQIDPADEMDEQIKTVKETLRNMPNKGLDYGVLRYLSPNSGIVKVEPQVCFNYLGQFDNAGMEGVFELVTGIPSSPGDPRNERPYALDINCTVENSCLNVYVNYSRNRFSEDTIIDLAKKFLEEIRNVLNYCMQGHAGYTPSDFDLAGMSQDQLDDLIGDL
jgi:iturin family lipopeptide synthetase B